MSPQTKQQTDEELIVHYQQYHDREVLGELFKRHSLMCYAVCVKYLKREDEAHDATMSIFEKLFTDLKQHQIQNFKGWLHSVCRNYCLQQLRKSTVVVSIDEEESDKIFMQFQQFMHQGEDSKQKEEKLELLEKALSELKSNQRICVELFYLKQKSYEEIAKATGLSMNEVKSNLQNGKRNLKTTLNEKGIIIALCLILWI
jgi:RNA polymerase sigma factor (sigma-70 family)